jgi:hypothetical protein
MSTTIRNTAVSKPLTGESSTFLCVDGFPPLAEDEEQVGFPVFFSLWWVPITKASANIAGKAISNPIFAP